MLRDRSPAGARLSYFLPTVRGQTVVIETHRMIYIFAAHAPETGDEICMAVGIYVSQMQIARHSGGGLSMVKRGVEDEGSYW